MKNSKLRKVLLLACSAVLLVCLSVGATLAYLTSTDTVVNTFTVGKVAITLDEARVTTDGNPAKLVSTDPDVIENVTTIEEADRVTANKYHLLPGHTYTKDPTIRVATDSDTCWLFVKVENGIEAIEDKSGDTDTIATQMDKHGWTQLTDGESNDVTNVFVYKNAKFTVTEDTKNVKVFNEFTVADDAVLVDEKTKTDYTTANITITAYAVQGDGFDTAYAAWAATFGKN